MKKALCAVAVFCLMLCGTNVSAETTEVYSYYVKYETDCDTYIKNTKLVTTQRIAEYTVTGMVPQKTGHTFQGWSTQPADYESEPLYQPSERIELDSSVTFYAVWKDESVKMLSYADGLFPSQKTVDGKVRVTNRIPSKDGMLFCGWEAEDGADKGIFLPGEEVVLVTDTTLVPLWRELVYGRELKLEVDRSTDGDTLFLCYGIEDFDGYCVRVLDMSSSEELEIPGTELGLIEAKLEAGQYKAYILADKCGVEYKSNSVSFIEKDRLTEPQNLLTVYMDGKEMEFDVPPTLIDGHTFVTLRYFCEYAGADVYWDQTNLAANITYNGKRIKIKENSDVCIVNGEAKRLPAATVIFADRLLIPLRSVSEFMNCRVFWDESQKVYIFTEEANEFENNLFTISDEKGNYFCLRDDTLTVTKQPDFDAMWIFDTVDWDKGIYRIYNLCQTELPLEVKLSEAYSGQSVRVYGEMGYDGALWRLTLNPDGAYSISPANNTEVFLDIHKATLSSEPQRVFLKKVYR